MKPCMRVSFSLMMMLLLAGGQAISQQKSFTLNMPFPPRPIPMPISMYA